MLENFKLITIDNKIIGNWKVVTCALYDNNKKLVDKFDIAKGKDGYFSWTADTISEKNINRRIEIADMLNNGTLILK